MCFLIRAMRALVRTSVRALTVHWRIRTRVVPLALRRPRTRSSVASSMKADMWLTCSDDFFERYRSRCRREQHLTSRYEAFGKRKAETATEVA
jgi:hypothetical protein